jgi:hypothetical protein
VEWNGVLFGQQCDRCCLVYGIVAERSIRTSIHSSFTLVADLIVLSQLAQEHNTSYGMLAGTSKVERCKLHCVALLRVSNCIALRIALQIALRCKLHFAALYCIALHCISLGCVSSHCIVVRCSAIQCSVLQKCSALFCSGAIQCSVVQCSAVQCSAVQCRAVHCIALHCIAL